MDLLLPRTDAGVFVQAVLAATVFAVAMVATRRDREVLLFVVGLATMTAAWMALRTVH